MTVSLSITVYVLLCRNLGIRFLPEQSVSNLPVSHLVSVRVCVRCTLLHHHLGITSGREGGRQAWGEGSSMSVFMLKADLWFAEYMYVIL